MRIQYLTLHIDFLDQSSETVGSLFVILVNFEDQAEPVIAVVFIGEFEKQFTSGPLSLVQFAVVDEIHNGIRCPCQLLVLFDLGISSSSHASICSCSTARP